MSTTRKTKIDALMEKASQALVATQYFDAERTSVEALGLARQASDFERMARIVLPLLEARRQIHQQALDIGTVTVINESFNEESEVEAGCFVICPPAVGADARRLRLASRAQGIPVSVMCREPITQLGQCPIVAIAPGATVRMKITPPADPDAPDLAWFCDAIDQHGEFAIITLDAELSAEKRVDTLMAYLDAIPDHEDLHQALADACRMAHQMQLEEAESQGSEPKKKTASRTKAK